MGARRFYAFLIALLLLFSTAATRISQAQQLEPGEIIIVVSDAETHAPLANANVFLLGGDSPVSSLTNAQGRLTFPDVAPGTYGLSVRLDGYNRYDIGSFDVNPHARVTLTIAMTPARKTIASLVAHPAVRITSQDLNADSAQRKISGTLSDALNKLAGVSVDDLITGPDSAFNVSLHNHDASQTAFSINGLRINGPASGLIGAAQNLFTGASVSFSPTAGYIGGSVNFQTLRPTKLWTYDLKSTMGNYGAHTLSASITGTKGRLGIAIQHATTGRDSFLSGLRYEDQSGQTYTHVGASNSTGDLIKLNYTVDKRTSVGLSSIFTHGSYDSICSNFTTLLPCGYGPGAIIASHNSYAVLNVNSLIGNVEANFSFGGPFGASTYDYPQRYINGVLSPYFSNTSYSGDGAYGSASITSRRHTDSVYLSFGQFGSTITRPYNGTILKFAQPQQQYSDVGFSDKIKANEKLAVTHGLSAQSASGAGSSLVLSETADWTAGKNDTIEGSLSAGSANPTFGQSYAITDTLAADYDCHNQSAYVDGPSDSAVRQSSITYDLTWRHTYRDGNITFDAYRQNAYGQAMRAAVPILAEPDSIFAAGLPGFLQQLQNVWSSPTVCGATPFDPNHVYISQMISGLGQVDEGFTLSGRVGLGRNVSAFPTYALGSTYLSSLDPRLEVPGSYYATGRQLPHRPLRTAGLTIDGVMPKSQLEWLANAQFTSINNGHDLPAFTTYNAGLVFHTSSGTLTLLESNIFGTHAGLFSTYLGVNPMTLVGGGTFAFASDPLAPRQWQLTWDIPWHQRTPRK